MEGLLPVPKIVQAIKTLLRNKSTGLDGIREELLQLHTKRWAEKLAAVFEDLIHSQEKFSPFLRSAVIILLCKKGSVSNLANYRPISLLNSIVITLTMTYSSPSKCLRPKPIPTAQRGFVLGRCIMDNLILLQDVIYWAKSKCPQAVIFALAFKKSV